MTEVPNSASSASVYTFPSCFHVITLILIPASYDLTVQLQADVQLIWCSFFVAPCFSISWVCHMLFLHVNWKHMRLCCIMHFTSSGNSGLAICECISSSLQSLRIVLLRSGFVELWQLCFSCMWSLGFFPHQTPLSLRDESGMPLFFSRTLSLFASRPTVQIGL